MRNFGSDTKLQQTFRALWIIIWLNYSEYNDYQMQSDIQSIFLVISLCYFHFCSKRRSTVTKHFNFSGLPFVPTQVTGPTSVWKRCQLVIYDELVVNIICWKSVRHCWSTKQNSIRPYLKEIYVLQTASIISVETKTLLLLIFKFFAKSFTS